MEEPGNSNKMWNVALAVKEKDQGVIIQWRKDEEFDGLCFEFESKLIRRWDRFKGREDDGSMNSRCWNEERSSCMK
ncbi:hypothetical protein Tco_0146174 [Tanacetum coccineum]